MVIYSPIVFTVYFRITIYPCITYLLFIILYGKAQPSKRVATDFILNAEDCLQFLSTSTQVHQFAGKVHTLLNQRQVLRLSYAQQQAISK